MLTKEGIQPLLFQVGTPPFIHSKSLISGLMRDFGIALFPALIFACLQYGVAALRLVVLAVSVAVLTEYCCARLCNQKIRLFDGTAIVSGLLFAFLLPVFAPWWIVCIGVIISIALGKYAFGGLGANPLCIPLVGWAFLLVSWPEYLDANSVILNSSWQDPLQQLKYFGRTSLEGVDALSLFIGEQLGGLGTVYIGALCLGGLYLLIRKTISWEIPISFLCSVLALGSLLHGINPQKYIAPELYFLTGGTLFAAFFLATDYAASPSGRVAMLLYGLLAGVLLVLIRCYSVYTDGAFFAVLLANLCTPLLDLIRPKPLGGGSSYVRSA